MAVAAPDSTMLAESATETIQLPDSWAKAAVAVVVPTYNEAANLPQLAERLFALPLENLRLVVVDDNSPDDTGKVADELAAKANINQANKMSVIHRTTKDGIGRAYIAGMREAIKLGSDFIVQMDADLSHQPEMVPQLLGTLLATQAGLVIGSRYVLGGSLDEKWGLHRRLLSWGASFYINSILRLRIRDSTAGFKVWRKEVLNAINLDSIRSSGFGFQIEMHYRCKELGYKIVEIPIHFMERCAGSSKMSLRIQIEAFKLAFRLRFGKR